MRVRKVFAATTLTMVTFAPGWAEESAGGCLNKEQRRAVVATGQVMRLAQAIRTAHVRRGGDMIKARLCGRGDGYVYVLTLLARDGKVTRTTVDATNGAVIGSR
jgi:uncharacterized membrane protein YkoI